MEIFYIELTKVQRLYKRKTGLKIIIDNSNIEYLNESQLFDLSIFHPQTATITQRDDCELCGIDADFFVVEKGYSEHRDGIIYLISANHEGNRVMSMIELLV